MLRVRTIIFGAVAALALADAAVAQPLMTDDDRAKALDQLSRSSAGTYELPLSHSTLTLPQGYAVALGADARRGYQLSGNPGAHNEMEAMVVARGATDDSIHTITFETFPIGYVSLRLEPSRSCCIAY